MPQSNKEILASFEHHLHSEGLSQKTISSYAGDTKTFIDWLEEKGTTFTGDLTRFHITRYKQHLLEKIYTPSTINKKINSLHAFNHYLIHIGLTNELAVYPNKDKIKIARGSEGEIEVFSEKEIDTILFYLENRKKVSQRDRLTILLLLYTGMRVSELINLKRKDIDLLTQNIKVIGKGGKYREIPIKSELLDAMQEYLDGERTTHRESKSPYLLLTQRASKMDRDTVNKMLRKHGKQLELVMKPHKFRHTFCTLLLKKGVEITTVAKLAGHSSIQTTANFYINTSRKDKQEAVALL